MRLPPAHSGGLTSFCQALLPCPPTFQTGSAPANLRAFCPQRDILKIERERKMPRPCARHFHVWSVAIPLHAFANKVLHFVFKCLRRDPRVSRRMESNACGGITPKKEIPNPAGPRCNIEVDQCCLPLTVHCSLLTDDLLHPIPYPLHPTRCYPCLKPFKDARSERRQPPPWRT